MSLYKVDTVNSMPGAKASFSVEVPDHLAREYVTVANTAIAAVMAKVSVILIENENPSDVLAKGVELANKISD